MVSTKKIHPKISIIIPVYNVERYLRTCLNSLTAQTLDDIEIILINDGSTDKSWGIIQHYAKKDSRIVAIQQENSGAAVARNTGLEVAKGEYIGFVDSDDYVDDDYFEQLYTTAKSRDADMVCAYRTSEFSVSPSFQRHDLTAKTYNDRRYNSGGISDTKMSKIDSKNVVWLYIYRTAMIRMHNINFPAEILSGQDNIFNLKASYYANRVEYIDTPTYYHYVIRDGSLVTEFAYTDNWLLSRAYVVRENIDFMNSVDDYDERIYAKRLAFTLDTMHQRLSMIRKIDAHLEDKLVSHLLTSWSRVKFKERTIKVSHHPNFLVALETQESLRGYIRHKLLMRKAFGAVNDMSIKLKSKIKGNKIVHQTLKPGVLFIRKLHSLIGRIIN